MISDPIIVRVSDELKDLIPNFLANKRKELKDLQQALSAGDLALVGQLGHRIKGTAAGYGLPALSALGSRIENAGKTEDSAAAREALAEMADHLERLQIVYDPNVVI